MFALLLFKCSLPSLGQVSLEYFPSHPSSEGSIAQSCLNEEDSLRAQFAEFPHLENWTYVISDRRRATHLPPEPA